MLIIAGGGLSGAATATALAQAGREVTFIEREAVPTHKICGEFLSIEAQIYLKHLGFDVAALGGHRITHVRLIKGAAQVTAPLPFAALSVTRRALDAALRDHAVAAGATCLTATIRSLNGLTLELDQRDPVTASTLFLATGKHELRGAKRDVPAAGRLVGFKTYVRLSPAQTAALAQHVELYLFPGGYAGLQLVEDGTANLCLLIDRAMLKRLGGAWPAVLDYIQAGSAVLATRLAGGAATLEAPLTIAQIPYGFIHHAPDPSPIFRLGDQAGVIHSFTGDGMSIALHSAALAAGMFLAGADAASFHRRLAGDVTGQIRRASALHALSLNPLTRAALFGTARAWPGLLPLAARATRVPAARIAS
jgi:flavin-dependent dehydrogenase